MVTPLTVARMFDYGGTVHGHNVVSTWTGDGELKVSRRMREPTTTTSPTSAELAWPWLAAGGVPGGTGVAGPVGVGVCAIAGAAARRIAPPIAVDERRSLCALVILCMFPLSADGRPG